MSQVIVAEMKRAMIKVAFKHGMTDCGEIANLCDQAGLETAPMSVAGVKAAITKAKVNNILCRRRYR